jgi:hypothetical protein
MGAHQLALVSGKAVRAGGADLAMVVDRQIVCGLCLRGANRTTL